jgi:diguanylate cyclase (GGDEF)-like protein/PAS domain S-box-containing protein
MEMRFPPFRRVFFFLGLTAVYFGVGKLGLMLAIIHPSTSAVWPPTGIALAALLVWGWKVWPAIFIGALGVNLTTAGNLATSFGIAAGNTMEGLIGAYLIERYANGRYVFERSNDVFKFVILAACLSTMISATVGVTTLVLGNLASWSQYGALWLTWWQGDAMGSLLVSPLLIMWLNQPKLGWTRQQVFEIPLLFLSICLLALAGFCDWYPSPTLGNYLRVFCIPLVIWAAFRFGPREAATTSALFCIIVIWGTLQGMGPFAQENAPNEALLRLQLFMAVVSILGISIGVEVADRKKTARALIDTNEDLERRVGERTSSLSSALEALRSQITARSHAEERFRRILESNIIGFMITDMDGKVLEANDAFLLALGYTREELNAGVVGGIQLTPPTYHSMDEWARTRLNDVGYCPPFEKEYIRKDGSRWPVLVGVVRLDKPEPQCVCFVIDVTERRRAQDALQKSYDELERRIQERTDELMKANAGLEQEITLRKEAEEKLREISLHDPLTGLYNRRGFLALAEQHLLQSSRDQKEFLFFFADIDGLKQINDTLGHIRGDQSIIQAGNILRETFRKSDIVARIGGDEFAVVVTETKPELRDIYLGRMKQNLAKLNAQNRFPFILSLSIGVAIFDLKKMSTLQELMTLADEDLYQSKRARHEKGINVLRVA